MNDMQIPDCFCPPEGEDLCKWQIEVVVKMSHMENADATTSTVPWKMDNIPQPLAQVILLTVIDVINKNGAEVYMEWASACIGGKNTDLYKMISGIMTARGLSLPTD